MIKNIGELYEEQKRIWNEENEYFFGISTFDNWDNEEEANKHLQKCCDKFWNNGTNELKRLFEKDKCKDIDKLVENGYELIFDSKNKIVCLFGNFEYDVDVVDANKESKVEKERKRAPLAYLPYCNDLCMFLSGTEYALRITASINFSLITRTKNICKYQRTWTYDIENDEFNIKIDDYDPWENMTDLNKNFLSTCFGNKEITKDNYREAMKSIPEFNSKSILYFRFEHLSEIFKMVSMSNRFANPLMRVPVPINIVKMFSSQRIKEDNRDNGSFSNLVLTTNKLFSLENVRTIIYKSQFNSSFAFADCDQFFDAFKTSTNKSAGRSRLILDDIYVQNKRLYKKDPITGELKDMYDVIINKSININNNLSVISCSRFSSNNDPKRIMMTAKLRAQAINTKGEIDPFTHETPARIVFGDFEGFNYGDGIVISKSFAKKLENTRTITKRIDKREIYDEIRSKYSVGDYILPDDFSMITNGFMNDNLRNIRLDNLQKDSITVTATAPFSVGDKLTNLHGSKGIACIILEDDEMPYLENDLSDNMKAGPFEVLVSALSVYRRKSLGQIFEAWALATGHDDVNNIQDAITLYKDDMKEYSEKSLVSFRGTKTIKPCGINMMIRLNHDAIAQQSRSYLKSNYGKMLKFGEMELLNLAARNLYDIMNELDIRSVNKHFDSFNIIKEMQKSGNISHMDSNNLRFFNILKTIGFDFNLRNPENNPIKNNRKDQIENSGNEKIGKNTIKTRKKENKNNSDDMYSIKNMLSDDIINLFEDMF